MPTHPTLLQRVVSRPLFWIATTLVLFGLPFGRSIFRRLPPPLPVFSTLPDFQLTDENGQPFSRHQLDGKVWVADFVFTRCPGPCLLLSSRMEKVQKRTRQLGRAFHLVSFSVDPERDTPADLQAYARRFHANPRGWSFLTGPLGTMQEAVVKGFKIAMVKEPLEPAAGRSPDAEAPGFFDIVHGEHLALVDQRGRIRGYYEASDEGVDALVSGVAELVNTPISELPPDPSPPSKEAPAGVRSPAPEPLQNTAKKASFTP